MSKPQTASRKPQWQRGLTLVELLLAVALFAMLLAAGAGLVRSSMSAQVGWQQAVEPYRRMEQALARLERDLESAQPLFDVPFLGGSDRLEFARVDRPFIEGAPSDPDWVIVTYSLDGGAGGGVALLREESLWRSRGEGVDPLRRETLLSLDGGAFAFGVMDATTQQMAWATSWDGQTHGLPRLVRFDCALSPGASQPPVQLSRIVRHPAGRLPAVELP
jgi:prepilin-type N-terminal cleavage/methylation domain-containing protein